MLGTKIRELRRTRGITQEGLAALVEMPQQEISRIERGQRKLFTVEEMAAFASALGVSISVLLEENATDSHENVS